MTRQRWFRSMAALMVGAALSAQAPQAGADPSVTPPGACHAQGQGPAMGMGFGAQHGGGPMPGPAAGPMGGGPAGMRALRFLDLTAAQNKAVKDLLDQHKPALQERHKAMAAKETALREALEDPAATEPQLRALAAASSAARLQEVLQERALFQDLQAVLTPEQRAKAERLRKKLQKERMAHEEVMDELGEPRPAAGPGPGF